LANVITRLFTAGSRLINGSHLNELAQQVNAAFNGTTAVGAITSTGSQTALSATATTAGGATTPGQKFGTAGIGIYFGSGAPTVSAPQGSIYLRTDGSSTSTRLYVNSNGTTGWVAVTTAS
jgi:hypothetical protein